MRSNYLKTLKTAVLAISVLLLGVSVSFAQQTVILTAAPASVTLPDGSVVPMWGYFCGAVSGSTPNATCNALNPASGAGTWSPVVITIPTGQDLNIALTNSLGHGVPTSLVIVGQLGGGLGTPGAFTPSPDHSMSQQVTWPIAAPGAAAGTPPAQPPRVQSFGTEVADTVSKTLCWGVCSGTPALKPGTYLIESGTHPSIQGPMGLYGILVVTTAPTTSGRGIAYSTPTVVNYDAEIPLLFSEIDPIQNLAVNAAVMTTGFSESATRGGYPA